MALVKTSVDRVALPAELLPLAKSHMHVEFDRDDAYISSCLARAIALFEMATGFLLNPAEYTWTPDADTAAPVRVPVQPIITMTGKDADGADLVLESAGTVDPDQVSVSYITTPVSGATITLGVGFATAADLPPAALQAVLAIAARLYEWREQFTAMTQLEPMWLNDMLVGFWVPRI